MDKVEKILNKADKDTINKVENGDISINEAYKKIKQVEKETQREEERQKLVKIGKKTIPNIDIRLGDFEDVFKDIPDGSVDCIITDPPYPHEYINCWSKLSRFAKRVLKPNGFCIAYSGQSYLDEVIKRMSENLDYYWTMSMYMPGATQIVNGVNMMCRWKPILVFQNGKKMNPEVIQDYFVNEKGEKDGHDWQQGETGIKYLIEKYTKTGDLIIDPFCGAGTFAKIAMSLGRECKTAEIDEQTYNIAKARIGEEKW